MRYGHCLTRQNFVWSQLKDMNIEDMLFQQDRSTSHSGQQTIILLWNDDRIISHNALTNFSKIYVKAERWN